jgi:hypothetical protein
VLSVGGPVRGSIDPVSCTCIASMVVQRLLHPCPALQGEPIRQLCFDLGVEDVSLLTGSEINAPSTYLVFLNGLIVG